ncbi:tetratricopeptide repeat protein [Nocardiopsis aegyptia]|uniref:tetratricopeptide repeat protein n=1 Tax=Nocardiopsis aegyptia TaxID=220378 RepID=UPI00366F4C47
MNRAGSSDHIDLGGGTFQSTVVGKQVNHHHARHEVDWPVRVGTIPEEAGHYQRRAVTDELEAALACFGTAVPRQVLSGTGGVGKTQLAAHHARSLREITGPGQRVDVLVWTDAAHRDQVTHAYAQAAEHLFASTPDAPEDAARLFLTWLHDPNKNRGRRWLVVWDDLADPVRVRDLWPPHDQPHGRVLVTTRRRDHALTTQGRRLLDVDVYTPREAGAFLARALATAGIDHTEARLDALAHDLGHLPLALGQAVTYMAELGLGCDDYLDLFHHRMSTLDGVFPDWDHPSQLAATWDLSLARADTFQPLGTARPLMELIALLDGAGVPEHVLTAPPVLAYLASRRARERGVGAEPPSSAAAARPPRGLLARLARAVGRSPAAVPSDAAARTLTPHEVRAALTNLRRLNLITRTTQPCAPDTDTPGQQVLVGAHRLVQRATREHSSTRPGPSAVRALADALVTVWPEVERDTVLAQRLRGNATVLTSHPMVQGRSGEDWLWDPDGHDLLFRAGRSLGEAGRVGEAVAYWRHMAETALRRLGPDHPHTLIARGNLADWRGEAGDPAAASGLYEDLLADHLRVLGPDHPATLTTRHNLANRRGQAGDPEAAVHALHLLLADHLRVLGPDHPATLTTRHNLANWRGQAGDPEAAAQALQELLPHASRALGPDHPATLTTRHDLARWRGEAGDTGAATRALHRLLADRLRVLGPDHPHTLTTRAGLARLRGETGDPEAAVQSYGELLAQCVRVLGPDHPHTLATRHGLAWWTYKSGDTAAAVALLSALVHDRRRVLGPDHPHTHTSARVLQSWRDEAPGDRAATAG